jgi:hypothetical protein
MCTVGEWLVMVKCGSGSPTSQDICSFRIVPLLLLVLLPTWRATRDLETLPPLSKPVEPVAVGQVQDAEKTRETLVTQGKALIHRPRLMRGVGTNQLCGSDA